MHSHTRLAGTTIGLSLLFASPALAGLMTTSTFDDRSLWEMAAGGTPVVETFESETLGVLALPVTLDSGLGVDLSSGNVASSIGLDTPAQGFVNTTVGGRHSLQFGEDPDTGSYSVGFSLDASVEAFGFNISGWAPTVAAGGPTGGTNITLLNGGQVVDDFFLLRDVFATDVTFIGVASDVPFDEIRLSIAQLFPLPSGESDYVAFDDAAWVVPAPGGASLLALGGLIAVRRRR